MPKLSRFVASVPVLLLAPILLMACDAAGGPKQGSGGSTGNAGTTGAAGTSSGGGNGGSTAAAGDTGTAGATGAAGDAAGSTGAAGDTGTAGVMGSAGTTGTGGTGTAGKTGTAGNGGSTGTAGVTGTAGTTGTAGNQGTGGTVGKQTGKSLGCGSPPGAGDSSGKFALREVQITGLDPIYLTGGKYVQTSGKYNFANRPYSLRLPANYNPATAYAITMGGGGCGGDASGFAGNPGGGLQIAGNGPTIQIGLQYIAGCFSDGGPSIGNRPDTPELPYFRAVLADVEAHYCVDKAKVFVSGYSSGGWEAYTLGCAASDAVRGISADEGGFRMVHPPCLAPVAAVLVAGTADTENPIGPLDPNNKADQGAIGRLGSLGSAPGRDELLTRNGCIGNATTAVGAFDPKYTQCVKYTGCPAAYPVIWCALPGVGHNNSSYGGLNYSPGLMWQVLGALP